jgi:hypothetical protein
MSKEAIEQVIARLEREPEFLDRIRENPARALIGYDLTPEERTLLLGGDTEALQALGVDSRSSKVQIF